MRTYAAAGRRRAPLLLLAHGAGAGELHPWMERVGRGLAERGVTVVTFEFPYLRAGRRVPDRGPVLEAAFQEAWRAVASSADGRSAAALFAGGKSMGGRIATQVAATGGFAPAPRGVLAFGYPLHPPGRPAERRDRHLARVGVPLLLLHGTRDPFGSPDEMRALAAALPLATLHLVDGGDHSLEAPRRVDPAGAAFAAVLDAAAAWMRQA
ncbi:MAG: dienelactone hydrolase family protein [Acidobacteria bacterium]|nr:dienelactone hydrolase family protein [Acidobacteriota bacterium]